MSNAPTAAASSASDPVSAPVARAWLEELDQASRMEAVGALLIDFCESGCLRALLFVDYFGSTLVWRGGGSPELKLALASRVDFASPSIFRTAAQTRQGTPFVAPGSEADAKYFATFPQVPVEAWVIPIHAPRQQLLCLYVDGLDRSLSPTTTADLLAIAAAASRAYARITTLLD